MGQLRDRATNEKTGNNHSICIKTTGERRKGNASFTRLVVFAEVKSFEIAD
jgi:hypothetical protein